MLDTETLESAQKWLEVSGGKEASPDIEIGQLVVLQENIEAILRSLTSEVWHGQPVVVVTHPVEFGSVKAALVVARHARQILFMETASGEGQPVYVAVPVDMTNPPDLVDRGIAYFLAEKLKLVDTEAGQTLFDASRNDGVMQITRDAYTQGRVWTTGPDGQVALGTINEEYLKKLRIPILTGVTGDGMFPDWVIPDQSA